MSGKDAGHRAIAQNIAKAYAMRIYRSIDALLEADRAVPEPQLEHLFKVVLAFDQSRHRAARQCARDQGRDRSPLDRPLLRRSLAGVQAQGARTTDEDHEVSAHHAAFSPERGLQVSARGSAVQAPLQLLAIERLGQIVVHAGAATVVGGAFHGVRGQRDDRDAARRARLALLAADFARRLVAVELRHLAIHQDQVVRSAPPCVHRLAAVVGDVDDEAFLLQHARRDLLVDDVVFGKKDARPTIWQPAGRCRAATSAGSGFSGATARLASDGVGFGRREVAECRVRRRRRRDREPERRAHARNALDADVAAHQLGESLDDRQAEAGAAVAARGRRIDLRERVEQHSAALRRDADARVAHGDAHGQVGVAAIDHAHVDRDLAALGELHGVAAEVDQDLPDARRVADDVGGQARIDRPRAPARPSPARAR